MAHEFGAAQPAAQSAGPQPYIPQAPAATAKVLPHPPRPAFLYRWHPQRWMLADGEILPILGTIKLGDLGTNGVDKSGNIDEALMMSQKNGWTVLPWNVLGEGEAQYIRAYDATGGPYYCSKWETPQASGDRVLASKTDTAGYYGFLRELLKRGIIPAPDMAILEQGMLDVQAKRVESLRGKTNHPGVAEVYEVEKGRLASMQAAASGLGQV